MPRSVLRASLTTFLQKLDANPGMSGSEMLATARSMLDLKQDQGIDGIFAIPPRMMTATLDDGIGQGLILIHCLAELAGVVLTPLGLMQTPETIITECRHRQPDILGLTVLQYETEEMLCDELIPQLPGDVTVILGGPVFRTMGGETLAAKPYRVLNDAGAFLDYLLKMAADR
ncbi:MAG: hypothetical protein SWH61_02255 [Thermodesulfobacteriota bacterium]|nr:hypothetical protein [Thermodesulfobacteriota bacterium]